MLTIERLKVIPVQDLKPGELARLPDQGNSLVMCTFNERSPLLFLEGPVAPFTVESREDLYGPAIVYPDVEFEVCASSGGRDSGGVGDISLHMGNLVLTGQVRDRQLNVLMRTGLGETSHRIFFSNWRAVIRDGERETIVFERAAPPKADATIEMTPEIAAIIKD